MEHRCGSSDSRRWSRFIRSKPVYGSSEDCSEVGREREQRNEYELDGEEIVIGARNRIFYDQ